IGNARNQLKTWGLKFISPFLQPSRTVKLRTALVVPFVFQITLTGGILIFLSFRQGDQNVQELSHKLLVEINYRIEQEVHRYLSIPRYIQKVNLQAIEAGLLQPENFDRSSQVFWHQVSTFDLLDIGYGSIIDEDLEIREYVSAGYSEGQPNISMLRRENPRQWYSVIPDELGQTKKVLPTPEEDAQEVFEELWYTEAIDKKQTTWTKPYQWRSETDQISIDLTTPLYCRNTRSILPKYCQSPDQIRGILATSVGLEKLSEFLRGLKIEQTGKAFILEKSGRLIAHSVPSLPYRIGDSGATQIKAIESDDPVIAAAAHYLSQPSDPGQSSPSMLEAITDTNEFSIGYDHERFFILASPYRIEEDKCNTPPPDSPLINIAQIDCSYPEDWVIVTIVPSSDFLENIEATTQNTLIFSCISLIAVISIGLITARWINQGMLRLSEAAENFAQGNLSHSIILDQPIQVIELENLSESLNSMAAQLDKFFNSLTRQREAFARFFPSEFFEFLEKTKIQDINLGDYVSREMSITFSDIRSFTDLSERMTPQENFDFINRYLGLVSPTIREHQGFVVKFIGDGIMAIFPTGTDAAVAAGVAQFRQLQAFNEDYQAPNFAPIAIGMGIHTGQVMLGMLGEPYRLQGDAISAQVNFAARLEGLTKYFGAPLLISETTRQNLQTPDRYSLRYLGQVRVKGFQQPTAIYEVLDAILDPEERQKKEQSCSPLAEAIERLQRGQFQDAQQIFQRLHRLNPEDLTYSLYLEELDRYQQTQQAWDGVINFRQK
ncbi:MAG: adenylate/guanylate cyclase domain-containing protein, partial [Prochlorotrichaceae cyanobacterium]